MTRKEVHDLAIISRISIQEIWRPEALQTKRFQLYCKCRGLVLGDRVENAIFNHDSQVLQSRAFSK